MTKASQLSYNSNPRTLPGSPLTVLPLQLMLDMHANMLKLVAAQEEMRTQIEVMQRAMRNHFSHANAAVTITPAAEAPRPTSE